jgi:hypothetical protein
MQVLVIYSQDKDQFLKVAVKRMTETQILEDDLKEVNELNLFLLAPKHELEAKLAEVRPTLYFHNEIMSEWSLNWPLPCFAVYKDQLMALGIVPSDPDLPAKAFAVLKGAQIEVDTLTRAVKGLMISADKFAAQILTLEEKVKHLDEQGGG